MYFQDHPVPHFHASYGEHDAKLAIDSLQLIAGSLPRRQLRLVVAWGELHRDELRANWRRAASRGTLLPIEPLR